MRGWRGWCSMNSYYLKADAGDSWCEGELDVLASLYAPSQLVLTSRGKYFGKLIPSIS